MPAVSGTPFDCITFAIVTVDVPPFSSVSISLPSDIVAVSVPPATVFNCVLPPPILIAPEFILPATTG